MQNFTVLTWIIYCSVYLCREGLSHCRHLKTVRTHLSGLVHSLTVSMVSPTDSMASLTADVWQQMKDTGIVCVSLSAVNLYLEMCSL